MQLTRACVCVCACVCACVSVCLCVSVCVCGAERVVSLESMISGLESECDFAALRVKMRKAREMFFCNDPDRKVCPRGAFFSYSNHIQYIALLLVFMSSYYTAQ